MKLFYQLDENKDGLIVTGGEDLKGELNIPSEQNFEGKTYPVIKSKMELLSTVIDSHHLSSPIP